MFGDNGTRVASWIYSFLPMSRCHALKRWLLRHIGGIEIGEGTCIWSSTRFSGQHIKIGKFCHFGENNYIRGAGEDAYVIIGDNVTFGPNCYLTTGAHRLGCATRRSGPGISRSIEIGDGTGISVGAIIAAGAKIGKGCSICPGVYVSGKVADNMMLVQAPPNKVKLSENGAF